MSNQSAILAAAAGFALKCQYEGMVKWNLYHECAQACGVEYDPDHQDWQEDGAPAYDNSPNIKWERQVQSILKGDGV